MVGSTFWQEWGLVGTEGDRQEHRGRDARTLRSRGGGTAKGTEKQGVRKTKREKHKQRATKSGRLTPARRRTDPQRRTDPSRGGAAPGGEDQADSAAHHGPEDGPAAPGLSPV